MLKWGLVLPSVTLTLSGLFLCACGGGGETPAVADAAVDLALSGMAGDACQSQMVTAATDAGVPADVHADEFGPHAKIGAMASPLARMNIYEVTSTRRLSAVDVYVKPEMAGTRLTLAVHEAPNKDADFVRVASTQIVVAACVGYVRMTTDLILKPGYHYAIGFDPSQSVGFYSVSESGSLPVDGSFGRLIGSKTGTSVSMDNLDRKMIGEREYYRQRLWSVPADGPADAAPVRDAAIF